MCYKMTWAGCGKHVKIVMASVPEKDKCKCVFEKIVKKPI